MSVALPVAGTVGSLYTIPQSNWIVIKDRAAVVIEDQPLAQEIIRYVPNFDALVAVCKQWLSHTFPGIVAQAVDTSAFSLQAAKTLTELSQDLRPLKPNDPLPDTIRFIFTVQFAALHKTATEQIATCHTLASQTNDFVNQNRAADRALDTIIGQLGPAWQPIGGPLGAFETAMGDVQQGWTSVAAAFAAAASTPTTLTTAQLLALDVQAAIESWKSVATNAADFMSAMSSHSEVITGQA